MDMIDPEKVLIQQKNLWNGAAEGWEKWDDWFSESMSQLNLELVKKAKITSGMTTLDIGSGTGYPSLKAAEVVGEEGFVHGIDLSKEMLAVAKRKAAKIGANNVDYKVCNAENIDFPDDHFSAVTSRFCLMFVPRIEHCLKEIMRVSKPGALISAALWAGPEHNPALSLPMKTMQKHIDIPKPDPYAPGIFAFAEEGRIGAQFESAGFKNVSQEGFGVCWKYRDADEYMRSFQEISAPIRQHWDKLSPEQKEAVRDDITAELENFRSDGHIEIDGKTWVVNATSPLKTI